MKFECDKCHREYMIADEKLGKRGVKVRCKRCQHVIIVRPPKSDGDESARPAADDGGADAKAAQRPSAGADTSEVRSQPTPASTKATPGGASASSSARQQPQSDADDDHQGDNDEGATPDEDSPGDATQVAPNPLTDMLLQQERSVASAARLAAQKSASSAKPISKPSLSDDDDDGSAAPPDEDRTQIAAPQPAPPSEPAPASARDRASPAVSQSKPPSASPESISMPSAAAVPPPAAAASAPAAAPTPVAAAKATAASTSGASSASKSSASSAPPSGTNEDLGDVISGAFNSMFPGGAPPTSRGDAPAEPARKPASEPPAARSDLPSASAAKPAARVAAGADDGPVDKVWHVAINDDEIGPITLAELGRHIDAGRVDRDSVVWKAGMADWVAAGTVPELRTLFGKSGANAGRREAVAPPPFGDGLGPSGTPFDGSDDDASWRPHGLTAVYQAANIAEAATASIGGLVSSPSAPLRTAAPTTPLAAAAGSDVEWRPAASSALASLVQDEIQRIESSPPSKASEGLGAPDDDSIDAPLFGIAALGKDLDPAPMLDPGSGALTRPLDPGQAAYAAPPSYPQPSSFMPAPAAPAPSRSPMIFGGIAVVAVLVVVLLAVVLMRGEKPASPQVVLGPDGKPYIMGPGNQLIAVPGSQPAETPAATTPPPPRPEPPPPPPPTAAVDTAAAGSAAPPDAAPPDAAAQGTSAPAPPAAEPERVAVAKKPEVDRPKAPPRETATRDEPARPAPTETRPAKDKDCDPILDIGCKSGSSGAAATGPTAVKESLAKTDVLLTVKANMAKIEACGARNKATGIIKMSWKIQPSGKTSDVQVADSKFAGTPVGTCVVNEIKGWTFPQSRTTTPVNFPMKLGG